MTYIDKVSCDDTFLIALLKSQKRRNFNALVINLVKKHEIHSPKEILFIVPMTAERWNSGERKEAVIARQQRGKQFLAEMN